MLKMKNAAISMAVVLALAACGGGSGDPVDPGTQPPPAGGNPNPNPNPHQDPVFQGNMVLASSQIVENDRLLPYSAFADDGATGGIYGIDPGTDSLVRNFGLRVAQTGMEGQSRDVRIGIEIAGRETSERMQLLVSGVTLAISDAGVISVTVPATARAHGAVRNAAGTSTSASATSLPPTAVRMAPIAEDPTSNMLIVDMEALMGAIINAAPEPDRAALRSAASDFTGRYNMRMAISGVTLHNNGASITAGAPITVGDQPPLSGGGVSGNIWVRTTHPLE